LRHLLLNKLLQLLSASGWFQVSIFSTLLASAICVAQSGPQIRYSRTKEDLRGVSIVSEKIAWAAGTHGTYLRLSDGHTWIPEQVPGAETLDFRAVVAFSDQEAFLMSAGAGEQSRIYHTVDAGRHWQLQFTNNKPKGFFDAMVFWDRTHGVVLGDPISNATDQLKFELLATDDGEHWHSLPADQMPAAVYGEGAFAASNSCLTILGAADPNIWFATGGAVARVFHSSDRGRTWEVFATPIMHGVESQGIFSIAFRDASHGVIAGGDYKRPDKDGPDLAFTNDGGKTWKLSRIFPQSYYSAVAYDSEYDRDHVAEGKGGGKRLDDDEAGVRMILVGSRLIYDFRPPHNPARISPPKKSEVQFNAVSAYPGGGALVVGAKGAIATIP
jgi:photosystem II stability/assembly factor-like uncharacterized protein